MTAKNYIFIAENHIIHPKKYVYTCIYIMYIYFRYKKKILNCKKRLTNVLWDMRFYIFQAKYKCLAIF